MGALVLTAMLATTAAASDAMSPLASVAVLDRVERYVINASTIDKIEEQLVEHAERFENPGNASTRSRFEITKTLQQGRNHCEMVALDLRVTVTTILPLWQPAQDPSDLTRIRWKQSSAILQRHEAGHREHAIETARNLRRSLTGLKPKRDCMGLAAAIAVELQASLQHLNQRDARYDYRTWNGLRDDPLTDRTPVVKSRPRSPQRPFRTDRSFLDLYSH